MTRPALNQTSKKSRIIRYTLLGVGIAGVAAAGYWYFNSKADLHSDLPANDPEPDNPGPRPQPKPKPRSSAVVPERNDNFPLKQGSKGARVKAYQQALINRYGKAILPKYGADGDFGKEMQTALKKLNLPAEINESAYNLMVMGAAPDHRKLASELYSATVTKNFKQALVSLKKLRNVSDYKSVSASYKTHWPFGRTPRTLVAGLLEYFPEDKQKADLSTEFLRMGLIYDSSKWSIPDPPLSGLRLITKQEADIWKDKSNSIRVPARTVLGTELKRKGRYSLFENGGKYFLVLSSQVEYM